MRIDFPRQNTQIPINVYGVPGVGLSGELLLGGSLARAMHFECPPGDTGQYSPSKFDASRATTGTMPRAGKICERIFCIFCIFLHRIFLPKTHFYLLLGVRSGHCLFWCKKIGEIFEVFCLSPPAKRKEMCVHKMAGRLKFSCIECRLARTVVLKGPLAVPYTYYVSIVLCFDQAPFFLYN